MKFLEHAWNNFVANAATKASEGLVLILGREERV